MSESMRFIALKAHIDGLPEETDFEITEAPLPTAREGQFVAENHYVSVDPGMRSRLSGVGSHAPATKPGGVINGFTIGRVIDSRNEQFQVGDLVTMGGGWATHSVFPGAGFAVKLPEAEIPVSLFLGILGIPGMTAYFGLRRVAQLQAGDHVLVTSAAGPVGATAGQLAKHWGAASVTGIAGSAEKCKWLIETAGFDAAINYKSESDLAAAIAGACPEGVDVLFDNVGNAMVDTVIPLMRLHGRIIISGQTADYSVPVEQRHGIRNTTEIIGKRLMMQGLVVFDDIPQFPQAQQEMAALILSSSLRYQEEIFEGLESVPQAFCGLFKGENFGRRLVKIN